MKPNTNTEANPSNPTADGGGSILQRLVRCSTPLCGARAEWFRANPYMIDNLEYKCYTCFYRNQHNHNCWDQAGGLTYDGSPKWRKINSANVQADAPSGEKPPTTENND